MRWTLIDVSMIVVGLVCPWGFVVSDVSMQARRLGLLAGGLYLSYGLCCASPVGGVVESTLAVFGAALITFVMLAVAVVDPWWRGPPGEEEKPIFIPAPVRSHQVIPRLRTEHQFVP